MQRNNMFFQNRLMVTERKGTTITKKTSLLKQLKTVLMISPSQDMDYGSKSPLNELVIHNLDVNFKDFITIFKTDKLAKDLGPQHL